jgi:hypothetical protein
VAPVVRVIRSRLRYQLHANGHGNATESFGSRCHSDTRFAISADIAACWKD